MTDESKAGWKWYGFAGHLCVGHRCAFHLTTRVGGHLISTVGAYLPSNGDGRTYEPIGAGEHALYETYVFHCSGEDANGNPRLDELSEIDGERYADSREAEAGHYRYCHKYAT